MACRVKVIQWSLQEGVGADGCSRSIPTGTQVIEAMESGRGQMPRISKVDHGSTHQVGKQLALAQG
jgi:hypothetical protein